MHNLWVVALPICVLLQNLTWIDEIALPSLKSNEAERPASHDLFLGPPGSPGNGT